MRACVRVCACVRVYIGARVCERSCEWDFSMFGFSFFYSANGSDPNIGDDSVFKWYIL